MIFLIHDTAHLFYLFRYFFQSEQKTKSSIPAHSNNYTILSIRFVICYFVFVILIYRYLLFVYFFKNNTIPPPPVYIRMYPAPPRVCNCVPLYYYNIYSIIVTISQPCRCYVMLYIDDDNI